LAYVQKLKGKTSTTLAFSNYRHFGATFYVCAVQHIFPLFFDGIAPGHGGSEILSKWVTVNQSTRLLFPKT